MPNLLDQYPEKIQDAVIDNMQYYGDVYWIFPMVSKIELKNNLALGIHPLLCVYLPMINNSITFEECGNVAVPIIYQGIPGPIEVYEEKSSLEILKMMVNEFVEAFSEPDISNIYRNKDLKMIKKRFAALNEVSIYLIDHMHSLLFQIEIHLKYYNKMVLM
eukprot:63688_1